MLKRVGNRMVRLWQQYGSELVTISVFGNGRSSEIAEVRKRDLVYADIDIDVASLMPRTQPLRQETILNLLQMGVIDQQKALDALEFGGFEEAIGTSSTETLNARSENALLDDLSVDSETIEVLEYEDHDVHIKEHIAHVLLEQPGGTIRARFDEHIKKHKNMIAQAAQQAQAMQEGAQTPSPGGGPNLAAGGPIIEGSTAQPGGLPAGMVDMVEPGVDTGTEAALASMAGIE